MDDSKEYYVKCNIYIITQHHYNIILNLRSIYPILILIHKITITKIIKTITKQSEIIFIYLYIFFIS